MLSRRAGRWLPEKGRSNAEALGAFLHRHRRWRTVILFGYCPGPLPTNPLFITAGGGRLPLLSVTLTFSVSRTIADMFWV